MILFLNEFGGSLFYPFHFLQQGCTAVLIAGTDDVYVMTIELYVVQTYDSAVHSQFIELH